MRRLILRFAWATYAVVVVLVVLPLAGAVAWLATTGPARGRSPVQPLEDPATLEDPALRGFAGGFGGDVVIGGAVISGRVVALFVVVVLLAVAAGVVARLARRAVTVVVGPLDALGDLAEGAEVGTSMAATVPSGIAEVDRLERALIRGSERTARRLSAEREFAANASHQLRTPLTALLIRLEEIAATDDIDVVREESAIAIAQVERLSGVVTELMGPNRSGEEGGSGISLDTVLAGLQREWQPAFAASRRSIRVDGQRGLRVRATPLGLGQIFSTLVENSLAHGAGTVTFDCRRAGPSVVIEVRDEGTGIPANLAPHIFERRISSRGSGLGLGLARDLAETLGGRLELIHPEGAVFALFLSADG